MNDIDVDFSRGERQGFPEFVYGLSKSVDQLIAIAALHREKGRPCFITRIDNEKAEAVQREFSPARRNTLAQTLLLGEEPGSAGGDIPTVGGSIAIVSAGTSDSFAAAEAEEVLRFLHIPTRNFLDKGVSGLHRITAAMDEINRHDVIICIAGFEGALPSVVGGLTAAPVIAVPTSVGYGAAEGGRTALNAMLAGCAAGLTVVNIDNGFGAALAAFRICSRIPPAAPAAPEAPDTPDAPAAPDGPAGPAPR